MTLLLAGIVGSTAYGLAGPGSDIDRLGVYAVPTVQLHGLHPPVESRVGTQPDVTLHEARKWCRLALNGNPTVTELVWLPDDLYETRTALGDELIAIRGSFLSAPRVRDAYLGYAARQFHKLAHRSASDSGGPVRAKVAKHARHLARLIHQGRQLYATGSVDIRLADPQWFLDFGRQVASGDVEAARRLVADAERDFDRLRSPLPDAPDETTVEHWLHSVRAAHLTDVPC